MTEEIWKDIIGFEGLYKVSNLGNVFSIRNNINLKKCFDKDKYHQVTLTVNGKSKSKRVHRLVIEAFEGKSSLHVDHINGVKTDNRLSNLRYVTPRINNMHRTTMKRGFVGVKYYQELDKWSSSISIEGKFYYMGVYEDKEKALEIYNKAVDDWMNHSIKPEEYINPSKTSKYKGIYYSSSRNRWVIDYKNKTYGFFKTEEEAYLRLDEIKRELNL